MTMAPRTAEFSARSARRTTWPYQAGKSCDCWGRRTALMTTSLTDVHPRLRSWSRRFGPKAAEAPRPGRARAEAAQRRPKPAGGRLRSGARSSCGQSSEAGASDDPGRDRDRGTRSAVVPVLSGVALSAADGRGDLRALGAGAAGRRAGERRDRRSVPPVALPAGGPPGVAAIRSTVSSSSRNSPTASGRTRPGLSPFQGSQPVRVAAELVGKAPQRAVLDHAHRPAGAPGQLSHLLGREPAENAEQDDLRLCPRQPCDAGEGGVPLRMCALIGRRALELAIARRVQLHRPPPPAPELVERPPPRRREDPAPECRPVAAEPGGAG